MIGIRSVGLAITAAVVAGCGLLPAQPISADQFIANSVAAHHDEMVSLCHAMATARSQGASWDEMDGIMATSTEQQRASGGPMPSSHDLVQALVRWCQSASEWYPSAN
jgi:hypothetical protein